MSAPDLITVFGATGRQGGSVIRSLHQNVRTPFRLRGLTRSCEGTAARRLAHMDIEMMQVDGFNKSELVRAFRGSWAVFANTNSEDPYLLREQKVSELDLGRNIVEAAAEAGVKHFIYSSGADYAALSNGKVQLECFKNKNMVERLARNESRFETVSFVRCGWYLDDFLHPNFAPMFGGFPCTPDDTGAITLKTPTWTKSADEPIPWIDVAGDYGDIVHGMFLDRKKWNGEVVHAVSDNRTFAALLEAFATATGKCTKLELLPSWKDFDTHGDVGMNDLKLIFAFLQKVGPLYFGEITKPYPAIDLKKAAVNAKGYSDSGKLSTVENWFMSNFGLRDQQLDRV